MPPPRRSRRWLWFFLTVLVLAVAATVTLITYNLKQQLKAEDLDAAWALWKTQRPAAYEMIYTVQRGEDQREDRIEVRVRGDRTESLKLNGQEQEPRLRSYYGMDELFGQISELLRKDAEPGKPRVYCRAVFDPADGHLWWYVRRVMGSRERLEIKVVELRPLAG
jgi:hypothetical protein